MQKIIHGLLQVLRKELDMFLQYLKNDKDDLKLNNSLFVGKTIRSLQVEVN